MIYAAAGGTGVGVLQAAADEGILSIGVDSNQNYLHPGQVLTSMLKRVDKAVYDAFKEGEDLAPGINVLGLASPKASATRWTTTTRALVTPEMEAAVERGRRQDQVGRARRCTTTCPTTPARPRLF